MSTQAPFFFENNARIAQLALKHRLPSLSGEPNAVEGGALLFHAPLSSRAVNERQGVSPPTLLQRADQVIE